MLPVFNSVPRPFQKDSLQSGITRVGRRHWGMACGKFHSLTKEVVRHSIGGEGRSNALQLATRVRFYVSVCYMTVVEQLLQSGLMTNSQTDFLKSRSSHFGMAARVWKVHSMHRAAASKYEGSTSPTESRSHLDAASYRLPYELSSVSSWADAQDSNESLCLISSSTIPRSSGWYLASTLYSGRAVEALGNLWTMKGRSGSKVSNALLACGDGLGRQKHIVRFVQLSESQGVE